MNSIHGMITLVFLTCFAGGCASPPTVIEAGASTPAVVADSTAYDFLSLAVPIVYDRWTGAAPLTAAHRREIADSITRITTTRPWFISVYRSSPDAYHVCVYLVPDVIKGRLRRGTAFLLLKGRSASGEMGIPVSESYVPQRWAYAQVARQEVPIDFRIPPGEPERPFGPETFADDDLLKVIDVARGVLDARDESEMPVRSIEPESDGEVDVYFGWQTGPLSGSGRVVRVKRSGDGFIVTGTIGNWVS